MTTVLAERVDELRRDRYHAVAGWRAAPSKRWPRWRTSRRLSAELLERLAGHARASASRRAMGAIAGAAARILAAAHSGAHLPPEELRRP